MKTRSKMLFKKVICLLLTLSFIIAVPTENLCAAPSKKSSAKVSQTPLKKHGRLKVKKTSR